MPIIVPYILLCLLAGVFGRDSRLGFWGTSFVAVLFTPLTVLILLLLFGVASKNNIQR